MDMERLAEIFEAVKVVPLRESDLLVFRANEVLDEDMAERLRWALREATGHEKILIVDHGADLYVIREEAEPEPAKAAPPDAVARHMSRRLSGG